MMSGYQYWKKTFFLPDGTPRYYDHKTFRSIYSASSQAIDTLVFFHDRDPESLPLALRSPTGRSSTCRIDRLFLLPPVLAVARQQDTYTALGTSDDALRACRALQGCCRTNGTLPMKRKILIIVENLPVPFDTRVWKEATSLRENGTK